MIYDAHRSDNEAQSAEYASKLLSRLGGDDFVIANVCDLILATTHRDPPTTNDARLIVDIDLSILAPSPERYNRYCRQIREEYSFVSDEQFAAGRGKFLDAMLTKPAIYETAMLSARFETAARRNMLREQRTLRLGDNAV